MIDDYESSATTNQIEEEQLLKLSDVMRELEKQGVKVDDITTEHKKQIENYLEDENSKNGTKDKPTK